MKKYIFPMLCLALMAGSLGAQIVGQAFGHSGSPTPTVWTNGQTLTHTALNDTIAHMHNTLTGAIANANISASAGIAHSKMATPSLLPKAWATLSAACAASPCTVADGSQITSITRGAAGVYTVNLTYTPTGSYGPIVGTLGNGRCIVAATAASSFTVNCYDAAGAAADVAFALMVMDS